MLVVGGLIPSCRHKKLELVRVNLVSLPPASEAPANPEPVPPTPTPPEPTPPTPPTPPPPTPPPTPTPPEPTPPPPTPREAVKPPPKKVETPKRRLRTPEEIRKSAKLEKTPQKTVTPPRKTVNSQSIADTLTRSVQKVQISYKAPTVGTVSPEDANRYLSTISAILRSRWDQPRAAELGGRRPVTVVALTIARDGRVTGAKISRKSGNSAMDVSVQTLLNGLTRLPPPSQHGIDAATFSVDIAFETM